MIEACKTKSQVQVSKEFNIARGTLCGYLKDKVNLLKQYEKSTPKSANRKRHREGKEADIEEALFIWFNETITMRELMMMMKKKRISQMLRW